MNLPLPIPPVDEVIAGAAEPGAAWMVPVEMVVACASDGFKAVIRHRYGQGEEPRPSAKVFARHGRFCAVIFWPQSTDLLLPLDCHTWENGRRGGAA